MTAGRDALALQGNNVYNKSLKVHIGGLCMAEPLTRVNLMLQKGKVNRLRREFGARSNSQAVRIAIDRELAVTGIQEALRGLRALGTLKDVFNRAPTMRK